MLVDVSKHPATPRHPIGGITCVDLTQCTTIFANLIVLHKINMRTYVCEGFGVVYEVWDTNGRNARWKAARHFKQQFGRPEKMTFLYRFFTSTVKDPQKPGPKLKMPGELLKLAEDSMKEEVQRW